MTTAILVDDEANLLEHLQRKLAEIWPELDVIGTAVNGREALELAAAAEPDVAFLDIHMPGISGLEVARNLPPEVQVVFVTAYDQYAVEAFERCTGRADVHARRMFAVLTHDRHRDAAPGGAVA